MIHRFFFSIIFLTIGFSVFGQDEEISLKKAPLIEKSDFVGTLLPLHISKISSQVEGRVEKILFDVGSRVKKGDLLIELDPVFLKLTLKKQEAFLESAKALFFEAELEYKRMSALFEKGEGETPSIPQKLFDDAKIKLRNKKALLDQAQVEVDYTKQRLSEMTIVAPYDGVISKKFVDVGDFVPLVPSTALFEIIDDSKLVLEFSLPQAKINRIKEGEEISASLMGDNKVIDGKIDCVVPKIDEINRSFKCRVTIDNKERQFITGSLVQGEIKKVLKQGAFILPRETLLKRDNKWYVYLQKEGKKHLQEVILGEMSEKEVEIVSGITVEDQVIR